MSVVADNSPGPVPGTVFVVVAHLSAFSVRWLCRSLIHSFFHFFCHRNPLCWWSPLWSKPILLQYILLSIPIWQFLEDYNLSVGIDFMGARCGWFQHCEMGGLTSCKQTKVVRNSVVPTMWFAGGDAEVWSPDLRLVQRKLPVVICSNHWVPSCRFVAKILEVYSCLECGTPRVFCCAYWKSVCWKAVKNSA